jgi:hypothetical protein
MASWQILLIVVECIVAVLLITLNIYRRKQVKKQAANNADKDVISQKSQEVSKFTTQESAIKASNTLSEEVYNSSNVYAQIRRHNDAVTAAEKAKNLSQPAIEKEKLDTSSNKPQGNTQNRPNTPIVSKESSRINNQSSKIAEKQEKFAGSNTQPGKNISSDKIIPTPVMPKQVMKPVITAPGITQPGIAHAPPSNPKYAEPISHGPAVTPKINVPASGNGARSVNSDLAMELKTNLAVATTPWEDKLLPFQNKGWNAAHGRFEGLDVNVHQELIQLYADINLANHIVWMGNEIGHRTQDLNESYLKLRVSIANRINNVLLSKDF